MSDAINHFVRVYDADPEVLLFLSPLTKRNHKLRNVTSHVAFFFHHHYTENSSESTLTKHGKGAQLG